MCVSNAPRKTGAAIIDNPLTNIGSDKPALVKIGGSGASGVSIGTKGPGIVKVGGSGNAIIGLGTDKGIQFLGFRTSLGLKKGKGGLEAGPPSPTEPPTSRNYEQAIKTARAQARKRLALGGRRKTILTGGAGVLGFPDIYRKRLLGQ